MKTPESIQLERILHNLPHRHLFCWNGERNSEIYDCGCVLGYEQDWDSNCQCVCHTRIREITQLPNIKLWLYALTNSPDGILPKFPFNQEDRIRILKEQTTTHVEDCICSDCILLKQLITGVQYSKTQDNRVL